MATLAEEYQPVRVEAELDEPLSRWLWAIKWLLLVPHHVLLSALTIGFLIATALAFPVVLCTGRYPRPLFFLTTGALRWAWRVAFYSYGALATDRYPPFSLGAVPDYPARLFIDRPERLPRGLLLPVSRLRALPQLALLLVFVLAFRLVWWLGGLSAFLALLIVVVLAFTSPAAALLRTGRYPRRQFGPLVAFNRWLLQVVAYTFFLTDACPPPHPQGGGRLAGRLHHRPHRHRAPAAAGPVSAH
ncbi:hypothetical protein ADL22_06165 [Streptomyces sp. NRRL F-4489]|uniref:DUF4389 domain-containing protein n=1 Tax=Streptomyces sp. NRRL F-4489 TaxID=1609095 RepID=UPI00074B1D71|nr:DUF4389 domain-containing protein [Streptomyces sp. NRRL F-4489]KUL51381.1 hypothetical protein ADL22_06165 [Streptomyces sp. NRRL F-4489]